MPLTMLDNNIYLDTGTLHVNSTMTLDEIYEWTKALAGTDAPLSAPTVV
jgi:hypothetical protein